MRISRIVNDTRNQKFQQPNFEALNKLQKNNVIKALDNHLEKQRGKKPLFIKLLYPVLVIPSALYIADIVGAIGSIITNDLPMAFQYLLFAPFMKSYGLKMHYNALNKAPEIGTTLKNKGFNQEEREYGIKRFLSDDGDPILSKVFTYRRKAEITRLANGQNANKTSPGI